MFKRIEKDKEKRKSKKTFSPKISMIFLRIQIFIKLMTAVSLRMIKEVSILEDQRFLNSFLLTEIKKI